MIEQKFKEEIEKLGSRFRELREAINLIQLDLEVRCGISRTDISKIENGHTNIEFLTLVKIAESLKVELSVFFKSENEWKKYIKMVKKENELKK